MALHPSTFEYLNPTDRQKAAMAGLRQAAEDYAFAVDKFTPDGPDKTYALHMIRDIAMWVNVAVTREADGAPRDDVDSTPKVVRDYGSNETGC